MSYTDYFRCHIPANDPELLEIARQIGRALDPDVGGYDSWTPCGTTDAEGVMTVTHYESAGPCTSEFKAQAIAMLADPAVLCHVVSQDYAARWADLEPPTLGECVVFCAGVLLTNTIT